VANSVSTLMTIITENKLKNKKLTLKKSFGFIFILMGIVLCIS
jgi:hypothetical protein